MNKVDQMCYLFLIYCDFATDVIPFFRAVATSFQGYSVEEAILSSSIPG